LNQSAVLGDDAIDEVEVTRDAAEIIENAAGHEDDCDIAPSPSAIALSTEASGRSSRVIVPS
jgi:hypothetical protein